MRSLLAVILTVILVFEVIECQFGPFFPGQHFGHHRGRGHHRQNDYSMSTITKKIGQLEQFVERYLDKAISAAKARNSSDVEVLQELRTKDVPQFFDSIKQKLSAAQNLNSTALPTLSSPSINVTDI